MADDISASIITLHQPRPKTAKSAAQRAREYRERQRAKLPAPPVQAPAPAQVLTPVLTSVTATFPSCHVPRRSVVPSSPPSPMPWRHGTANAGEVSASSAGQPS